MADQTPERQITTRPITGRQISGHITGPAPGMRQCAYCGTYAPLSSLDCPKCHERFPTKASAVSRPKFQSYGEIRRGLLYILLAGVIHYFAAGYSAMTLPVQINPLVPQYLTPLLFLGGVGFVVYGLLRRARQQLAVRH